MNTISHVTKNMSNTSYTTVFEPYIEFKRSGGT